MKTLFKLSAWLEAQNLITAAASVRDLIKSAGIKEDLIAQYPQFEAELTLASKTLKPTYLRWVSLQLLKNEPINEIINTVAELEKFRPKLEKKDLYQYSTLGELRGAIESTGQSKSQKKKEVKQNIQGEFDTIYKDDQYLVVHPHSKEASCYFGQGTKWCVSATISENYFNQYASDNVYLYFILTRRPEDPDSNMNKIAYAYAKSQDGSEVEIFDSEDASISQMVVESHLKDKYQVINSKITEHLSKQENTKFKEYIKRMSFKEFEDTIAQIKSEDEKSQLFKAIIKEQEIQPGIIDYIFDYTNEQMNTLHHTSYQWYDAMLRFQAILKHPSLSTKIMENYAQQFYSLKPEQLENNILDLGSLLKNPNCPPEVLFKLFFKFRALQPDILYNYVTYKQEIPIRIMEKLTAGEMNELLQGYIRSGKNLPETLTEFLMQNYLNDSFIMTILLKTQLTSNKDLNAQVISQIAETDLGKAMGSSRGSGLVLYNNKRFFENNPQAIEKLLSSSDPQVVVNTLISPLNHLISQEKFKEIANSHPNPTVQQLAKNYIK